MESSELSAKKQKCALFGHWCPSKVKCYADDSVVPHHLPILPFFANAVDEFDQGYFLTKDSAPNIKAPGCSTVLVSRWATNKCTKASGRDEREGCESKVLMTSGAMLNPDPLRLLLRGFDKREKVRKQGKENRGRVAACLVSHLKPAVALCPSWRARCRVFSIIIFAGSLFFCTCVCPRQKGEKLFMASQSPLAAQNGCDVCSCRQRIMW